jgi:hypothetical protein
MKFYTGLGYWALHSDAYLFMIIERSKYRETPPEQGWLALLGH